MLRPSGATVPRVHPQAFIDQSAQIIGDIEIGDEVRRALFLAEAAGIQTSADHYVSYSRTYKD